MQRHSERIQTELEADLIVNRQRHQATVENLSDNGIKIVTESTNKTVDCLPDETIDLKFEAPSGETLNLSCIVRWTSKISSESLMQDIGLEIAEYSSGFEHFYKSLFMDNMSIL